MSARDVIANVKIDVWGETGEVAADAILSALTASSYRILGPDEVDPVTVEKCAALCEQPRKFIDGTVAVLPSGRAYATAIRTLTAAQDK